MWIGAWILGCQRKRRMALGGKEQRTAKLTDRQAIDLRSGNRVCCLVGWAGSRHLSCSGKQSRSWMREPASEIGPCPIGNEGVGTAGLKGLVGGVDWRRSASIVLMLQVCVCVLPICSAIYRPAWVMTVAGPVSRCCNVRSSLAPSPS